MSYFQVGEVVRNGQQTAAELLLETSQDIEIAHNATYTVSQDELGGVLCFKGIPPTPPTTGVYNVSLPITAGIDPGTQVFIAASKYQGDTEGITIVYGPMTTAVVPKGEMVQCVYVLADASNPNSAYWTINLSGSASTGGGGNVFTPMLQNLDCAGYSLTNCPNISNGSGAVQIESVSIDGNAITATTINGNSVGTTGQFLQSVSTFAYTGDRTNIPLISSATTLTLAPNTTTTIQGTSTITNGALVCDKSIYFRTADANIVGENGALQQFRILQSTDGTNGLTIGTLGAAATIKHQVAGATLVETSATKTKISNKTDTPVLENSAGQLLIDQFGSGVRINGTLSQYGSVIVQSGYRIDFTNTGSTRELRNATLIAGPSNAATTYTSQGGQDIHIARDNVSTITCQSAHTVLHNNVSTLQTMSVHGTLSALNTVQQSIQTPSGADLTIAPQGGGSVQCDGTLKIGNTHHIDFQGNNSNAIRNVKNIEGHNNETLTIASKGSGYLALQTGGSDRLVIQDNGLVEIRDLATPSKIQVSEITSAADLTVSAATGYQTNIGSSNGNVVIEATAATGPNDVYIYGSGSGTTGSVFLYGNPVVSQGDTWIDGGNLSIKSATKSIIGLGDTVLTGFNKVASTSNNQDLTLETATARKIFLNSAATNIMTLSTNAAYLAGDLKTTGAAEVNSLATNTIAARTGTTISSASSWSFSSDGIYVDSSNDRLGVGVGTTPQTAIHTNGTVRATRFETTANDGYTTTNDTVYLTTVGDVGLSMKAETTANLFNTNYCAITQREASSAVNRGLYMMSPVVNKYDYVMWRTASTTIANSGYLYFNACNFQKTPSAPGIQGIILNKAGLYKIQWSWNASLDTQYLTLQIAQGGGSYTSVFTNITANRTYTAVVDCLSNTYIEARNFTGGNVTVYDAVLHVTLLKQDWNDEYTIARSGNYWATVA